MTNQIKNYIEEGEKKFEEKIKQYEDLAKGATTATELGIYESEIRRLTQLKEYKKEIQISLIKMIMETCCKDCQNKIQCINEKRD